MLKELLNTSIEIEGLIRIALDGIPSPESIALLKSKARALSAECEKLEAPKSINPKPAAKPQEDQTGASPSDSSKPQDDEIFLSLDAEDPIDVAPETTIDVTNQSSPKSKASLKSLFSLNDRFLFSRELFEGNMKMFDSTLKFIEGIESFSDIEDYFYSELEWNPEDPNVASYLDILRPHFKE